MSQIHLRLTALTLVVISCLAIGPAYAGNGSIGLFFDADCASCSRTTTIGVPFTLFVNATLEGFFAGGIVGAEFRITGLPPGWTATVTPSPQAARSLGSPLDLDYFISFDTCQTQSCVSLCTILVVPTTAPADVRLHVMSNAIPGCGGSFCAIWLFACNAPTYTRYPVNGGTAIINGPSCAVATELSTWSSMKQLYGE